MKSRGGEKSLSEQQELTERLLLVRQLGALSQLEPAQLAPLAASIVQERFEPGQVIIDEGDPPRSFYLIRDGLVRGERRGKIYGRVTGPTSMGLFPMLARSAGSMQAIAETSVLAYRVDDEVVHEVFEDHFIVLLGVIRGLAESLLVEFQRTAGMPDDSTPYYEPVATTRFELTLVEKIAALRRMRPFAKATVASLARLAVGLQEVRYPSGELLWKRGESGDFALIVLAGEVEQSWEGGSARVNPGFVLGGAEAISNTPRSADARTTKPLLALRGSRAGFVDAMEDSFDLGLHFVSFLASAMLEYWDVRAAAGQEPLGDFAVPGLGRSSTSSHLPVSGRFG